jgi:chloramphenicol-sensitive protein RarD
MALPIDVAPESPLLPVSADGSAGARGMRSAGGAIEASAPGSSPGLATGVPRRQPLGAFRSNGLVLGVAAYGLWGILPVYWKWLQAVPAFEVLCHRMAWSFGFLALLVAARDRGAALRTALRDPGVWVRYSITAAILGSNWYVYIWGVQQGRIVDTSLGYFLNPLVTMALGVVILGEKLRGWQWVSVGCAAAGVAWLTLKFGQLPWISIFLAVTFAVYTLLRKVSRLGSVDGLVFEGLLLLPFALFWLGKLHYAGSAVFLHQHGRLDLLLIGAGVATSLPLLLFTAAARKLPLVTIGLLQYLAPTVQFSLGVFVYGEPFHAVRLVGFSLIWLGIAVYMVDAWVRHRAPPAA